MSKSNLPQRASYGLVLAGGGGKGAYQVGVWKALSEFGVANKITHISGTSVGALNAVLFAQGNYLQALSVWNKISPSDVLDFSNTVKKNIFDELDFDDIGGSVLSLIDSFVNDETSPGLFARKNLEDIMNQELNYELIKKTNYKIYACCYNKSLHKGEYFNINSLSKKEITKVLLASSAIPGVFTSHNINGYEYLDGAVVDNTPVLPLYQRGVRNFIVVYLSQNKKIPYHHFPKARFVEVVPSSNLGGLFNGTLNFSKQKVSELIDLGYKDCLPILK